MFCKEHSSPSASHRVFYLRLEEAEAEKIKNKTTTRGKECPQQQPAYATAAAASGYAHPEIESLFSPIGLF